MVSFRPLEDTDVEKFHKMVGLCLSLNLDFNGTFSVYNYNGEDKVLYYDDGYGVIFYLKDDDMFHKAFALGDNYEVECAQFDDWYYEQVNGIDTVVDMNTGIRSSLYHYMREGSQVDRDKCNGIVAFIQYNGKLDKRVTISYQQYKAQREGKGYVFSDTFNKAPFSLAFENHVLLREKFHIKPFVRKYLRIDGSYGDSMFNIMTIHDYGLIPFLKEGAFSLQRSNNISRYYRILKTNIGDYTLTTYPIGLQHNLDDMKKKLTVRGFDLYPSQRLIDLYNCRYGSEFDEYFELANSLKEVAKEKGEMECSSLVFKEHVK